MSDNSDPNGDFDFDFGDDEEEGGDPFADSKAGKGPSPFDFEANSPAPAKAPPPPPRPRAASKPAVPSSPSAGSKDAVRAASLAADVPVQVVAVMGKKTLTVQELVSFKKGQVVELNRFPNEAIDLVANGKLMAKGELVEIEGKLGVRIIKIFD